jgi:hypothetical protein
MTLPVSIKFFDRLHNNQRFNTVNDLALVILDQCSRVFFDRTQETDSQRQPDLPRENRPEVMDIFASTIGKTVYCLFYLMSCRCEKCTYYSKTDEFTTAYEKFWESLNDNSNQYRKSIKASPLIPREDKWKAALSTMHREAESAFPQCCQ